ncbi:MAG: glycosyltransferase family 4 protein [Gaiellaceae bacterium]
MKVLFASHTGELGGGEHSLLGVIAALTGDVELVVAAPPGQLADALAARGVSSVSIPPVTGSFALHPVRTPRAVLQIVAAGFALRRVAARLGADLVHANSVRAGLAALSASRLGGPPAVVHVRDILPDSVVARAIQRFVAANAAGVVANSAYTAARFQTTKPVDVVYPSLAAAAYDPTAVDRIAARARFGLAPEAFVMGVVAQLTPWKGQELALRVLACVRHALPAARLVLAGEAKFVGAAVRFDNAAYERSLHDLARHLGQEGAVEFVGEQRDVVAMLAMLDVLLVPSWEEPFGRVALEGMVMALPVLATSVGGPSELIADRESGFLLDPRDEDAWVSAVRMLAGDPPRRAEIGARARHRALEFTPAREAAALRRVYEAALTAARGTRPVSSFTLDQRG